MFEKCRTRQSLCTAHKRKAERIRCDSEFHAKRTIIRQPVFLSFMFTDLERFCHLFIQTPSMLALLLCVTFSGDPLQGGEDHLLLWEALLCLGGGAREEATNGYGNNTPGGGMACACLLVLVYCFGSCLLLALLAGPIMALSCDALGSADFSSFTSLHAHVQTRLCLSAIVCPCSSLHHFQLTTSRRL